MSETNNSPILIEGRDYIIENGRWVFTAFYLLNRGYCCENVCRNCPWKFGRTDPPQSSTGNAND